MHEYAPAVITLVAMLVGILFNRSEHCELRADMNTRLDKVDQRFDRIEARLLVIESDSRAFNAITGELKWRLDAI